MAKSTTSKETPAQDPSATVVAQYNRHTPAHFCHDGQEYHLYDGESYTLPLTKHVESLIGQGILTIIP